MSKSPDSRTAMPCKPDTQETELRAAGQVPKHHALFRTDGEHPAIMPDRRTA